MDEGDRYYALGVESLGKYNWGNAYRNLSTARSDYADASMLMMVGKDADAAGAKVQLPMCLEFIAAALNAEKKNAVYNGIARDECSKLHGNEIVDKYLGMLNSGGAGDCLATNYVPNDSCQTPDAVAIQIVNNCHRAVHVRACIATNGPQPACGGYHIDDGAALTHYTCHGLMRFSVSEIP